MNRINAVSIIFVDFVNLYIEMQFYRLPKNHFLIKIQQSLGEFVLKINETGAPIARMETGLRI